MDRINLLWKQIDAPVGFGCKLYIRKHSEKDFKVSKVIVNLALFPNDTFKSQVYNITQL